MYDLLNDVIKVKLSQVNKLIRFGILFVRLYIIYSITNTYHSNTSMSARRSNQYQNHQSDTFNNSISHQFQRDSSNLYLDRNSVNKSPGKRPYSNFQPNNQNNRPSYSTAQRSGVSKLNKIKESIHQVINLCKDQNQAVDGQFTDVISYEKQILNLLMQNPQLLNRVSSNQNVNMANHQSVHQAPRRQEQITPFRVPPTHFPQSQYYIPSIQQSARGPTQPQQEFINSPHENFAPQYIPQQAPQYVPQNAPGSNNDHLQQNFNNLRNNKQILLNEDAIQLISQIQQKAFAQIERLRQQKLILMQKLNQQIKNFNNERKKNIQLQNELRQRGFVQGPDGGSNTLAENQYLRSQLARLQNQHAKAVQIINKLQFELSKKVTNAPGIEELLRQGEVIRLQTLRLLKLKEAEGAGNQRVKQLQKRLAFEENQKLNALNEVRALKARLGQVQGSSSNRHQQNYSSSRNQKGSFGKSPVRQKSNEYQDMIYEMKKISGY